MKEQNDLLDLLGLLTAPGFCVQDNRIIRANPAAQALQLTAGMEIRPLLESAGDAYAAFEGGCLCLTLTHLNTHWSASVTRCADGDVFVLEDRRQPELQALALAARELRGPLNNAMMMAQQLQENGDPQQQDRLARLNRGLYQLLRITGNMSDAGRQTAYLNHNLHEMNTVISEIVEKVRTMTQSCGINLQYFALAEPVYTLCDPQQLERAVMNLVSNSIKFTPAGGSITIRLVRSGSMLRLSVEDTGSGIADGLMRSIFCRYLRQSNIEDSRYGIGLGLVLVRDTALQHGGTVLIDRPQGTGTRVTLTLAIRQEDPTLRQNILFPTAGGYDTGLIELSEILPAAMFDGSH